MAQQYDVVVVGGGHNGLVAAGLPGPRRACARWCWSAARSSAAPRSASTRSGPTTRSRRCRTSCRCCRRRWCATCDLDRHGYHVYPQGPYFAPHRDGRYLQLPDDRARAGASRSRSSPPRTPTRSSAGTRWLDATRRGARPAAHRDPAEGRARAARPTWPGRRCCCAGCKRRRRAQGRRPHPAAHRPASPTWSRTTSSPTRMRGVLAVSGVIGTWAGPALARHRVRHAAPPHRRHRRRPDRRVGLPARRHGRRSRRRSPPRRGRSAPRSAPRHRSRASPRAAARRPASCSSPARRSPRRPSSPPRTRRSRSCACSTAATCPADFVEDIERWKTRSGTVKVNLAVDRLPEFTSQPGLRPAGARRHDRAGRVASTTSRARSRRPSAGRPATLPFADICIPSVFDDRLAPRGPAHRVDVHPVGAAHLERRAARRRARGVRRPARRADGGGGARASPTRCCTGRCIGPHDDGARVRPGRRQHLPRRAHGRADVPRAPGRRLRRPAHPDRAGSTRPGSATHGGGGVTGVPGRNVVRQVLADRKQAAVARPAPPGRALTVGGLQAALPARALRRPPTAFGVERERCCCAAGPLGRLRRARLTELGTARARRGWPSSTCSASPCCVTIDTAGALHAHYNVCRHRGSQVVPVDPARPAPDPCARRSRCAARTTRGPTTWTARCCTRRTPRTSTTSTAATSPCTRSAWTPGAASSGCTWLAGRRRDAARRARRRCPSGSAATRSTRSCVGRRLALRRRRQLEGASPRTTTSATTAARCTPSSCGSCRPSAAAAPTWTGTDGVPHREGAWTFTLSGTSDRAPFPDLDERRAGAAQGRAGLPQPAAVAVRRARRRVRAARRSRSTAPRSSATCCSRRTRSRRRRFDPSDAAELLGPGQPAGLGDLRVGAARHVVARLPPGLVRPDGGRVARHPPLAAARGSSAARRDGGSDGCRPSTSPSSGSAALGSATAWQLARRGAARGRARAVRARARARRLARHARGSSGTATTRPTTSR